MDREHCIVINTSLIWRHQVHSFRRSLLHPLSFFEYSFSYLSSLWTPYCDSPEHLPDPMSFPSISLRKFYRGSKDCTLWLTHHDGKLMSPLWPAPGSVLWCLSQNVYNSTTLPSIPTLSLPSVLTSLVKSSVDGHSTLTTVCNFSDHPLWDNFSLVPDSHS